MNLVQRAVPQAGSLPKPWPWQVWVAVFLTLAALFVARSIHPPPLAVSSPTLSFLGETCTVAFHATNHTQEPTEASLLVIVGLGYPGSDSSPPSYTEFARQTVSVKLAPKESKELSNQFQLSNPRRPNHAQIEIVSAKLPAP